MATTAPIRVELDQEGLKIAFAELLEEGFQRGKIERLMGDSPSKEPQLAALAKRRTVAAGYYRFATHIFSLDAERNAGIELKSESLAYYEGSALRLLTQCRAEHRGRHPECSRCGIPQENKFHPACTNCGAKFARKGVK